MAATLVAAAAAAGARRRGSSSRVPARATGEKPLNLFNTRFGVQDPGVPLPKGVAPGSLPGRVELTEEQVAQFEEDGVLLVRGALREWVDFLRAVADHQVEYPNSLAITASLRGPYEYNQINTWMTNDGIRDFMYYSALGHVLAQLSRTEEVRLSTDNLLINPHKTFGWHQDNQTGPIDVDDALRFWGALDTCGPGTGAPEYLLGSHRTSVGGRDTCFVEPDPQGQRTAAYPIEPGDLLVWHCRTIHQLIIPEASIWTEDSKRRVISGTSVRKGARYYRRTLSGVMGDAAGHDLSDGDLLTGPYFPRIFPTRVAEEERARRSGELTPRSPLKVFERKLQGQFEAMLAGSGQ